MPRAYRSPKRETSGVDWLTALSGIYLVAPAAEGAMRVVLWALLALLLAFASAGTSAASSFAFSLENINDEMPAGTLAHVVRRRRPL